MFSDTSTGTCWRPLCTASVKPTMSGLIIERRDQVLIGRRSFLAAATRTFAARCRSRNGPFFNERGTDRSPSIPGLVAALDHHVVGPLVAAGLLALGVPAPRAHRVRIALACLAFAAAVRMVDRIHGRAAHCWPDTAPALCAGLAVDAQIVLIVAHFADGGAAVDVHLALLAGFQAEHREDAFARGVRHGA